MPMVIFPHRDTFLELNPNLVRNFKRHIAFGDFRLNECWPWTGATRNEEGRIVYGEFGVSLPGRPHCRVKAHRVSLVLQGRELDPRFEVSHICENGLCVNPSHLTQMQRVIHRRADAHARNLRDINPMFCRWIIPHERLWEGWELDAYNAFVQARDTELQALIAEHDDGDGPEVLA